MRGFSVEEGDGVGVGEGDGVGVGVGDGFSTTNNVPSPREPA